MPNSQKGFAQIFLVIFLLVGIAVTVYLVGKQTNLLPKAFLPKPSIPETSFTLTTTEQEVPLSVSQSVIENATSISPSEKVRFKPSYKVRDIIPVALLIRSDIDEVNLFVAKIKFSSDILEVVSVKLPDIPLGSQAPISSLSFIKNWVEQFYDSSSGVISLVGGVPSPGYKTNKEDFPGLMTVIFFRAKKAGTASVSFTNESQILRNIDNQDILTIKRDTEFKIEGEVICVSVITPAKDPKSGVCKEFPTPCEVPDGWVKVNSCQAQCPEPPKCDGQLIYGDPKRDDPNRCPSYVCKPTPKRKGDGNLDEKVNLTDMSVLLSDFNKEKGFREPIDMNDDGKINTFDFSLMRKLLIDLKVIKGQ